MGESGMGKGRGGEKNVLIEPVAEDPARGVEAADLDAF